LDWIGKKGPPQAHVIPNQGERKGLGLVLTGVKTQSPAISWKNRNDEEREAGTDTSDND
jgi:hypothetical protein